MGRKPDTRKRNKYLDELRSGKHHRAAMTETPKWKRMDAYTHELAALAAGYSKPMAYNHTQAIDNKVGLDVVSAAYETGLAAVMMDDAELAEKAEKLEAERQRRNAEEAEAKAKPNEQLGFPIKANDNAHVGLVRVWGRLGNKALRFIEMRNDPENETRTDRELMIESGFSEWQARNPGALKTAIAGCGGQEVVAALGIVGVDGAKIAEVIAHFLDRKELVPIAEKTEDGRTVYVESERLEGNAVKLALDAIREFNKLVPPNAGMGDAPERLSREEMDRLDRLLVA